MAPHFIRVEFCPRVHNPSPLQGPAHDDRTVLVNIEPCYPDLDSFRLALREALKDEKDYDIDLEPLKIQLHGLGSPCKRTLGVDQIKAAAHKCGPKWDPADVQRTLRVHVITPEKDIVALPDPHEEDDDDQPPSNRKRAHRGVGNGNEGKHNKSKEENELANRGLDQRGGSRKRQSPRTPEHAARRRRGTERSKSNEPEGEDEDPDDQDADKPNGADVEMESDIEGEEPRYLFFQLCKNEHGFDQKLPWQELMVRIDRPHCQSKQDVLVKTMDILALKGVQGIKRSGNIRYQFHRTDHRECQKHLGYNDLLSDHALPTKSPDIRVWAKEVVQVHVVELKKSSPKRKGVANPKKSSGKKASSRREEQDVGAKKANGKQRSSGLQSAPRGENDDLDNDSEEPGPNGVRSNDEGGYEDGQNDGAESQPVYFWVKSCLFFHPFRTPVQLRVTCVRVDPPFVSWAKSGIASQLVKKLSGLEGRSRIVVKCHAKGVDDACEPTVDFQDAMRNHSFTTDTRIWKSADMAKILLAHFTVETSQGSSQGNNSVRGSILQPDHTNRKRSTPEDAGSDGNENEGRGAAMANKKRRTNPAKQPSTNGRDIRKPSRQQREAPESSSSEDRRSRSRSGMHSTASDSEWDYEEDEEGKWMSTNFDKDQGQTCGQEQDTAGDYQLCNMPSHYENSDDRRYVRIGVLETPKEFTHPADEGLPMRMIVVALVDTEKEPAEIEYRAIDSWRIGRFRVGDYPSADDWDPDQQTPAFTPDIYWRAAYEAEELDEAIREFVSEDQEYDPDNDSEVSAQDDPEIQPDRPIMPPVRPEHTDETVRQTFGVTETGASKVGQADFSQVDRINAVVCFANVLTEETDPELGTYRNYQMSLHIKETLSAFRKCIRNCEVAPGRNLKQILRELTFGWWGDFQVWITPVHPEPDGTLIRNAYCWDDSEHANLMAGQFVHPENQDEEGNACLFIEIRVVADPLFKRKEKAWIAHGKRYMKKARSTRYGWKLNRRKNGICILDDVEDKGQIKSDKERNTWPVRQR